MRGLCERLAPYTLRPWFRGVGCNVLARDHSALEWVQNMCDWDVGCPALGIFKKRGPRVGRLEEALNTPKGHPMRSGR